MTLSYEILEPVGARGMREVYKARDTRLDRMVVIKELDEPERALLVSRLRTLEPDGRDPVTE